MKQKHITAQRTADGLFLGACLSIDAEDLPFVGSDTGWLKVEKKVIENRLEISITDGGDSQCTRRGGAVHG